MPVATQTPASVLPAVARASVHAVTVRDATTRLISMTGLTAPPVAGRVGAPCAAGQDGHRRSRRMIEQLPAALIGWHLVIDARRVVRGRA